MYLLYYMPDVNTLTYINIHTHPLTQRHTGPLTHTHTHTHGHSQKMYFKLTLKSSSAVHNLNLKNHQGRQKTSLSLEFFLKNENYTNQK